MGKEVTVKLKAKYSSFAAQYSGRNVQVCHERFVRS